MIRRPYHPANLQFQPHPKWKVIALAWVAKALGVQFKINGIPYGGAYKPTEGLECVKGAEWEVIGGAGFVAWGPAANLHASGKDHYNNQDTSALRALCGYNGETNEKPTRQE